MGHMRVMICRVDDESEPDRMTELHSSDLPAAEPGQLHAETALDELETEVLAVGHEVMQHLLKEEWAEVDRLLVEAYQRRFPPRGGDV